MEGVKEVEIRKENGVVLVIPLPLEDVLLSPSPLEDPIRQLGENPIAEDVTDASIEHDHYIYRQ